MPKAPVLDQKFLLERLHNYLCLTGPSKAQNICAHLKISQSAFSRLIKRAQYPVIRIGHGSKTLYACHRLGFWGWNPYELAIPIFCIDKNGMPAEAAILHPLAPKGFHLESHSTKFFNCYYENLPYFLEDSRPSGFLGRLIPLLRNSLNLLNLPEDILKWSDDNCLTYLANEGWDLIGNLLLGKESCNHYLSTRKKRTDIIREDNRDHLYPNMAKLVLSQGQPGSSAAGEHPKFLSILETKKGLLHVMVKFSPPVVDAISQRVADLLICENIAHKILRKYGKAAPQSCLIKGEGRLFLEIERFDRNTSGGRRGIISLRALDLQFVGQLKSWPETGASLLNQKIIDQGTYQEIIWLEVFGRLIGNSDRHHGNISFFCNGERILGLAPVYDMLPMMYAPQQNQLVGRIFNPEFPKPDEKTLWKEVSSAAQDFWIQVQKHSMISDEFKNLTAKNESKCLCV